MTVRAKRPLAPDMLLDVGNSRLKWALIAAPGPSRDARPWRVPRASGSFPVTALHDSHAALSQVLRRCSPNARIYVCNVAGPMVERRIRAAAAGLGLPAPQFARSASSGAGIVNGYVEAWRLGVDRWVALIGARHLRPARPLCIVSIGSAMTIDLLAADGRHQGGSITPGPYLMLEALLQSTAGIRRRAGASGAAALTRRASSTLAGPHRSLFARDTRTAVLSGCLHACAELIERALVEGRERLGSRLELIVTGGGAAAVLPLLRSRYRRDDDLVLHGLSVLARAHSRSRFSA